MATQRQKKAIKNIVENGGIISKGMIDAGYSPKTAKTPQKLTESKAWSVLVESMLSDDDLIEKHKALLNSQKIEHMVFPLGCTDEDITLLLNEANCIARRFQHSETQTHVWFWSPDNKARKDALDMAYKLKGSYAPEKKSVSVDLAEIQNKDDRELAKIAGLEG